MKCPRRQSQSHNLISNFTNVFDFFVNVRLHRLIRDSGNIFSLSVLFSSSSKSFVPLIFLSTFATCEQQHPTYQISFYLSLRIIINFLSSFYLSLRMNSIFCPELFSPFFRHPLNCILFSSTTWCHPIGIERIPK